MIVIFSGYNQRAVITFLRTLKKNKIEHFGIIACAVSDPILKTDYERNVIYIRKNQQIILEEIVFALQLAVEKANGESVFIAPSTESLNRFFLQNRDIFEKMNCIIPLVNIEIYEQISDKEKFYNLCKESGIPVPAEHVLIDAYQEPLVAKPKKYRSGNGKIYSPFFLRSEDEYKSFIKQYNGDDFNFQEYLTGGNDFYLLFYFSKNGKVYSSSQKNFVQQLNGKSMIAAGYSNLYMNSEVITPYINLFHKIHYIGLVMVEVMEVKGIYYMIEANPRFWGPSQLFYDMKYNFFEFMLQDYHLISHAEKDFIDKDAVYFWSGGVQGDLWEDEECLWHKDENQTVKRQMYDFLKADIYKRDDTMMIYYQELLENLYMRQSKHSNYQILSNKLASKLSSKNITTVARWEHERLFYMKKHIDFSEKNVLDIGGNTGFFTFETIESGACHVDYFEGNQTHAKFVQVAAKVLEIENKVTVYPEYYMFDNNKKRYDIALCLNVVHHLGDDFKREKDKDRARLKMIDSINNLSECANILIFQMGFNWKGDHEDGLFENGTKMEMIEYLKIGTQKYWDIIFIGIAEKKKGKIKYYELNGKNKERDDMLGEFLNRPIFIMKSKV